MANPDHLKILRQGVERWNKWRDENPSAGADLARADLRDLSLNGANFLNADLSHASLVNTGLSRALLVGADLHGANLAQARFFGAELWANLSGADLTAADLTNADLREADLSGAKLEFANLRLTDLRGADLTRARVAFTSFDGVDLGTVKGLESIRHDGPSTIGIDTIYLSRGNIPEVFLRGCGVPDNVIEYMHSLTGQAFEFYSCFISYSTKDQDFAERLYNDLRGNGVRCWFAPHDIKGGHKIHEQIDDAIRVHDKLLLILSEHSMNSEWVKTEIAKARKRELKEKRKMLFPVSLVPYDPVVKDWECFDADTGKDSAREIREYYIPDFSSWKDHDSYQKAFQRLVGDLKAETKSAAG
jgi:TIR domain/Pentapeptide repeats (8 copies)